MMAVVSYCPHAPKELSVSANTWGRGIAVNGGEVVAVTDNSIWISQAADIVVSQEALYATCGVRGVAVERNTVNRIEVAPSNGHEYAQHAVIDVNSSHRPPVDFIDIRNNEISDGGFAGIRILGNVCNLRLQGNDIRGTGRVSALPPYIATKTRCAAAKASGRRPRRIGRNRGIMVPGAWAALGFAEPQGPVLAVV